MGVTVKVSNGVRKVLKKAEADAIAKRVSAGLEELAAGSNAAAKGLWNSGQTILIVCFGDARATAKGLHKPKPTDLFAGPGETAGDFARSGTPKKGGTCVIAIDCDKLKKHGLDGSFEFLLTPTSMFRVIVHELLHATHVDRRHPPDTVDLYEKWIKAFQKALARAAKKAKQKKAGGKKGKGGKKPGKPGKPGKTGKKEGGKVAGPKREPKRRERKRPR